MRAFVFKPKKIEFDRLPVKPTGIPAKPAGKPVGSQMHWDLTGFYRFPVKPVRFTGTGVLRFGVSGWGKKNPGLVWQQVLFYHSKVLPAE